MDSIPWLIETLVGLYFKDKQLDLLEAYQAWQEELLEKSILRAEALWRKQKDIFRARDQDFYDQSNAIVYEEHDFDCAMNRAGVSATRNYGEVVKAGADITDVYSSGNIRHVHRQASIHRIRRTGLAMANALSRELTLEEHSARAKFTAWTNTMTVRNLYDASALTAQFDTVSLGAEGLEKLVSQGAFNFGALAGDILAKTSERSEGIENQSTRDSQTQAPIEERSVARDPRMGDKQSPSSVTSDRVQSSTEAAVIKREVIATQESLRGPSVVTGSRQNASVGERDVDLSR